MTIGQLRTAQECVEKASEVHIAIDWVVGYYAPTLLKDVRNLRALLEETVDHLNHKWPCNVLQHDGICDCGLEDLTRRVCGALQ